LITFALTAAKYLRDSRIFLSILKQLNEGYTVFWVESFICQRKYKYIIFLCFEKFKDLGGTE